MKRFLALALLLGASTLALPGCGEEAKTEVKTETTTPGGSTETKSTETVKQTGENPPAPPVEEPKAK
ncbi:hypothetical protein ACYOEI_34955 [Singulisphaera rosea]